ncbi:hypothetical protein PYCCODRAFT_1369429 [Trametes coccinea BRFM310]|uniref:F-box domain-containing protein n=1 Tax=Trametes coccinea (strain BRFM310) TaxID=1353009 RepID=A0A1Y2ILA7_TRAC3|nr:hypothetical protein PYCCODRAFT_1369429 [Trametes coccinea BRFM310]
MSFPPSDEYSWVAYWDDIATGIPDPEDDPDDDVRKVDPRPLPEKVVELDKTISDLEKQVADLKLKRERLLAERALITRLPSEIMCRIFELAVNDHFDFLSHINVVCRRWRDVALACPALWTYIVLDVSWTWRIPAFLRKLEAHIQRSQGFKLFIDINLCQFDTLSCQPIMAALQPHLSRCYTFHLAVPDWPMMRAVREYTAELGPALEKLSLRIEYSQSEFEEPVSIFAQPCPLLKSVRLEHVPLECLNIATPNLRYFFICRDQQCHSSTRIAYPFKELMSMLTASPMEWFDMRLAVFNLDSAEDAFAANPKPYRLPDLEHLRFDDVDSASVTLFLDTTTMPRLRGLSVFSGDDVHWITRIALSPDRFSSLRILNLRNTNLTGASLSTLIRALHRLPQLTGLGLAAPSTGIVGDRFFETLSAGPETMGEWLLPRLEALCFQSCPDISGHELLRVVTARRGAAALQVANIIFLQFSQCYNVDNEALVRLEDLVPTVRVV